MDDDDLDPTVAAVLAQLWLATQQPTPQPWSLARLSKQAGLAMSTLQRTLTSLEEAGLVRISIDERERTLAALTAEGRALCSALFDSEG